MAVMAWFVVFAECNNKITYLLSGNWPKNSIVFFLNNQLILVNRKYSFNQCPSWLRANPIDFPCIIKWLFTLFVISFFIKMLFFYTAFFPGGMITRDCVSMVNCRLDWQNSMETFLSKLSHEISSLIFAVIIFFVYFFRKSGFLQYYYFFLFRGMTCHLHTWNNETWYFVREKIGTHNYPF